MVPRRVFPGYRSMPTEALSVWRALRFKLMRSSGFVHEFHIRQKSGKIVRVCWHSHRECIGFAALCTWK